VKILFDQGTPAPLRLALSHHTISTAYEMGWSNLQNGDLLKAAEDAFELFVTTDQNLRFQQDLTQLKLAVLVLSTTSWPSIEANLAEVVASIDAVRPGEYREVIVGK
jgi:hypothetical protein